MPKTFASLFSGVGCLDQLPKELGYDLVYANEYDPEIADLYRLNHGDHIVVEDFLTISIPDVQLDWLHISPPCVTDSGARNKKTVANQERLNQGLHVKKIVIFVEATKAKFVTMENVPAYYKNAAFATLREKMAGLGYQFRLEGFNAKDAGLGQDRKRTIACWYKSTSDVPKLKKSYKHPVARWASLVDWRSLPPCVHTAATFKVFDNIRSAQHLFPILVERIGYRGGAPNYRSVDQPAWTIKASIADDGGTGNGRSKFLTVITKDGLPFNLTTKELAKLQGFAAEFKFSGIPRVDVRAIGNGCPPQLMGLAIEKVTEKSR